MKHIIKIDADFLGGRDLIIMSNNGLIVLGDQDRDAYIVLTKDEAAQVQNKLVECLKEL